MYHASCALPLLAMGSVPHPLRPLPRMLLAGWGQPTDAPSAEVFTQAGLNMVFCSPAAVEVCRQHGLQAVLLQATGQIADSFRDDPAVCGYHLSLDSAGPARLAALAERSAQVRQADPSRPLLLSLAPGEAAASTEADLQAALEACAPDALICDYFQWWQEQLAARLNLELHRRLALEAGVPLLARVEASAHPRWEASLAHSAPAGETPPYEPQNHAKLRQSVFTALAYGAKGLLLHATPMLFEGDWRLDPQTGAPLQQATGLRPEGTDAAALGGDLQRLGPAVLSLVSREVYYTAPLPQDAPPVPEPHWYQARTADLLIGELEDQEGITHLMIVNRSLERTAEVLLRFAPPPAAAYRCRKQNGHWVLLSLGGGGSRRGIEIKLTPGDGELVRIVFRQS